MAAKAKAKSKLSETQIVVVDGYVTKITINDLFLFAHLHMGKRARVGKVIIKDRFIYFSSKNSGSRKIARAIYEKIKRFVDSRIPGTVVDYQVFDHLGFLSEAGKKAAEEISKSTVVAQAEGRLVSYTFRRDYSDRPSDIGNSLPSIVTAINRGSKRTFRADRHFYSQGGAIKKAGIRNLMSVAQKAVRSRRQLPKAKDFARMPLSDAMRMAGREALRQVGLSNPQVKDFMTPEAHARVRGLRAKRAVAAARPKSTRPQQRHRGIALKEIKKSAQRLAALGF